MHGAVYEGDWFCMSFDSGRVGGREMALIDTLSASM